jgi:hypothetical protein
MIYNPMNIYDTIKSDKIVLDIETDKEHNILQIAYNIYDSDNNLIGSKDMYVYDGIHSTPFYPVISSEDIIKYGLQPNIVSDIVTKDINNTNILIGHNIISFDLMKINQLNSKFNNKIKDTLIVHDTMIKSRNIVNAKNKLGKLKHPKLQEMYSFLCNKEIENAHNAYGDVVATFECYQVLCDKYGCFK